MIKTTLVAMTLLGCDCDAKICEFVTDTAPKWDSVTSCESAIRGEVVRRTDLNYPLLTGECRIVGQPEQPAVVPVAATPIASAAALTTTTPQPSNDQSSRFAFVRTATGYVTATGSKVADGVYSLAVGAADAVAPRVRGAAAILSPLWPE